MRARQLTLCLMFILSAGCFDRSAGESAAILDIFPSPLAAGERATVSGVLLPSDSMVFIDGRRAVIEDLNASKMTILVPGQTAAGHRLLLLRSPSLERPIRYPVEVISRENESKVDAQQQTFVDFGIDIVHDQFVDAAPPKRFQGIFSADPSTERAVAISVVDQAEGELTLQVTLPESDRPVWGAAFHLLYDPNILTFRSVSNRQTSRILQVKEPSIGRLLVGWIIQDQAQRQLAMEFDLVGSGEARLDFPVHHRTLRDEGNIPLPEVSWLSGSVRVTEVSP